MGKPSNLELKYLCDYILEDNKVNLNSKEIEQNNKYIR